MLRRTGPRKALAFLTLLFLFSALSAAESGCGGTGSEVKDKVEEAVRLISSSQPLLEDLLQLDQRLNTLGQRYPRLEDTLAEGKSLAEMALVEVEELESRYSRARDLLREAADMEGAEAYGEYARLIAEAVELELEALSLNRRLLTAVYDMLDVLPLAESSEQLSYYVEEIDRLTEEISRLFREGAEAAARADAYCREHGL